MKPYTLLVIIIVVLFFLPFIRAAEKPNIVLLITDQQQATALSAVQGSAYLKTPNMDSLAAKGIRFTRAYTANPLCMPARAAIFTGHYPHQTGFQKNNNQQPAPPFKGLAVPFRNAGYKTYYFGKWHLKYKPEDVEQHGFEVVKSVVQRDVIGKHDSTVSASAIRVLKEKQTQPFLAVVSYLNPHDICQYPRGETFPSGAVGEPPDAGQCPPAPANRFPAENETDTVTFLRQAQQTLPMFPVGKFQENDWRKLRWVYYRLIEKVDNEIGQVLKTLKESGNDKNTLLVFTSDHGECAGSHAFNQKTVLYEESVGVPLVIVPPDSDNAGAGTDSHLINTGVDLLPTLLDYAGVPVPDDLPGKSLRPLAEKEDGSWNRNYIVVQNHQDQTGSVNGIRPSIEGRLVVTDNFKYTVYSQGIHRESLFDIKNDPGETKNLANLPEYAAERDANRKRLQEFAVQYGDTSAAKFLENSVAPVPITHSAIP
ncbi:MAG: sulfatase-like hydrolase/transferase [Planctomycetaceae bacterium]|jgi:choline-sulfatase|nr:sulfatase-like hydrolase/transferase [Planctomycetaceae bacterium]